MKKFLLFVALVAGAVVIARKIAAERTERDLWAEVTDPLP